MNRRDFLKSLAGIPFLGFLKPEVGLGNTLPQDSEVMYLDFNDIAIDSLDDEEGGYFELVTAEDVLAQSRLAPTLVKWNGAGDSWESDDGGETWKQTGFRGIIYSGEFVYGDTLVAWDGHTWKEISDSLT